VTAPARIRKRFAELRAGGELGIVAYIIAGDPTVDLDFPPAPG
jgi:tryptophan synthase alpha subunit